MSIALRQPTLSVDRVYSCKKQCIPFWTIVVTLMPPIQMVPTRGFSCEAMPHFLTQSFAGSSTGCRQRRHTYRTGQRQDYRI